MRFKEFNKTESILDEVSMAPTTLKKWASSPDANGILMGIEFEMCVQPQLFIGNNDDLSHNPEVWSIENIMEFYFAQDPESVRVDVIWNRLSAQYRDWADTQLEGILERNSGLLMARLTPEISKLLPMDEFYDQAKRRLGAHNDETWELA